MKLCAGVSVIAPLPTSISTVLSAITRASTLPSIHGTAKVFPTNFAYRLSFGCTMIVLSKNFVSGRAVPITTGPYRTPIYDTIPTIDQTVAVHPHKNFLHRARQPLI